MQINFRQGIVSYPFIGITQQFLNRVGNYMTLNCVNGPTFVSFANTVSDYLLTESLTVNNAWGPLISGDQWLYWDLNTRTAVRTFGITIVPPVFGPIPPALPIEDQHWFDTTTKVMKVYLTGGWRDRIRVFAAKVTATQIFPMGSGLPLQPFAGTQVGITGTLTFTGSIIFDNYGLPIRLSSGTFLTTESQMYASSIGFSDTVPINTIKLEANVVIAEAATQIGEYAAVAYTDFGTISPAVYGDTQSTTIAICPSSLNIGDSGNVVIQGMIVNPAWDWSAFPVGQALWISDVLPGSLTPIDPFISNPVANPTQKPPVARTVTPQSVIFDQGLGGLIFTVPPPPISCSNLDLSGAQVFAQQVGNDFQFRTLKSDTLTIVQNANNITIETVAQNTTAANLGTGAGVWATKVGDVLNFKSLKSLSPSLTITTTSTEIQFTLVGGSPSIPTNLCDLADVLLPCPPTTNPDGSIFVYSLASQAWVAQQYVPYDLRLFVQGQAGTSPGDVVAAAILTRPMYIPIGAGVCDSMEVGIYASKAYAFTPPSTTVDFAILIDDVLFGKIRFTGLVSTGVFQMYEEFNNPSVGIGLQPGTRVTIVMLGSTPDLAISNMAITLSGMTNTILPTDGCLT